MKRQTLLIVAMFCMASAAYAASTTNTIIGTYTNWPDSFWQAIPDLNDPVDTTTGITGANDFVGDSTNPCGYWAYNDKYVFFRMRVHTNTVADWTQASGPLYVFMNNAGAGYTTNGITYGFGWDIPNLSNPANHGLEMMTNQNITVNDNWGGKQMNDVDLNNNGKGTNDINGNGRTTDGYVRTIDNISTANFGTTLFVDFAVSWNYLESYTKLGRNQSWRVTFVSGKVGDNDNMSKIGDVDVAGGSNPGQSITLGWTTTNLTSVLSPTAVRETVVQVERDETGNQVRWQTGHEVSNLGFNIYRSGSKGWERLNPSLIAGSALVAGHDAVLTAGNSYGWWDPDGGKGASYCVESVDLNGETEMHGPALASASSRTSGLFNGAKSSSPLLDRMLPNAYTVRANHPKPMGKQGYDGRKLEAMLRSFASKPAGPTQTQQEIAAGAAVKIGVSSDGWYEVPRSSLLDAGLNPNANPELLRLYADGIEQPLLVQGQRGKIFESIAFYGTELDTPYSDTRVYWLTTGGGRGLRIKSSPAIEARGNAPTSFPYTIARRDRVLFFAALHSGDGADNFFGPVIGLATVNQTLAVHHATSSGAAPILQVNVQGVSAGAHTVNVQFNGINVGTISFAGQEEGQSSFTLDSSTLKEGDNTVTLTSVGGGTDTSLVDTVSLTYAHSYDMDGAAQRFTAPAGPVVITSSSPQVVFYDVTDPGDVRELKTRKNTAGADGTAYAYKLFAQGETERVILAVQMPDGIQQPAWIKENEPSQWHEANNSAQLVIVSHSSLLASAQKLAAFRTSQGFSSVVVNVEDLYDEFSFGAKDPMALRDYLQFASTAWKTPPRYVLLMGDATFDPRDHLGLGGDIYDLVPTKIIDTGYVQTASDDWFADFNGTGVPAMAIGRLPARSSTVADRMVSKIIGYEQTGRFDFWRRQLLFVADTSYGCDFQGETVALASLVPPTMSVASVMRGAASDAESASQIRGAINSGSLVVNYLGHGSTEIWRGNLLTSGAAQALNNGPRLPFFIHMTCLNAYFHDLYTTSLGEALMLAPNGGAVGVWASSSLTNPHEQAAMNRALLQAMFANPTPTVGEAILKAKAAISDNDVRRSWILLGDPTTRIR